MNTVPNLKRRYKFTIASEFDEQPCILGVTHYLVVPPDRSCRDSDLDYYGFREIEFDVLHEDGEPWPEADAEIARDRGLQDFYMNEITGEEW